MWDYILAVVVVILITWGLITLNLRGSKAELEEFTANAHHNHEGTAADHES